MQLAGVTDPCADLSNGKIGRLHVLAGLCHTETDQEFLRRNREDILKDLAEIAAV